MDSADYNEQIADLKKRLEVYTKFSYGNKESKTLIFGIPTYILYIIPPLLLLILFLIIKPSYLMKEITKDDKTEKTLIYSKLFLYSLLFGFIIDIGIWIVFIKKITM